MEWVNAGGPPLESIYFVFIVWEQGKPEEVENAVLVPLNVANLNDTCFMIYNLFPVWLITDIQFARYLSDRVTIGDHENVQGRTIMGVIAR